MPSLREQLIQHLLTGNLSRKRIETELDAIVREESRQRVEAVVNTQGALIYGRKVIQDALIKDVVNISDAELIATFEHLTHLLTIAIDRIGRL